MFARGWSGVVALTIGVAGCTTSGVGTGGGGSASSSQGADPASTPCSKNPCDADELCAQCRYSLSEGHECHDKPFPTGTSFACDWLACAADEACVHVEPLMDGCFSAACVSLPQDCAANPTCACAEAAVEQLSPMGAMQYNAKSCAVENGHAFVTAFAAF